MLKFKWETGFRQTEIGEIPNLLDIITVNSILFIS